MRVTQCVTQSFQALISWETAAQIENVLKLQQLKHKESSSGACEDPGSGSDEAE